MLSPHWCMVLAQFNLLHLPWPLQLSAEYQSISGRVLTQCEVCGAQVALSNLQRLTVDCHAKVSYRLVSC